MTNSCSNYRSLWLPDLLWILALVAVATVPFLSPTLDLKLLGVFYHPGGERPWPHEFDTLWRTLYTLGTWPALLTALAGLTVVVVAPYKPRLARWRRHALMLFLTLVLGPGLFVNTIFKDHWGRPRPRQVSELGGTMRYQCFYEKGVAGRGKSFACGHSSMGYYFVVLYFLARRKRRWAPALWMAAFIYGTLIGTARMAAGAHFVSDVLWSAVFPCAVAWLLYYVILDIPRSEDALQESEMSPFWRSRWVLWAAPPLALAAIAAVLLGTPAFTEIRYDMTSPDSAPMSLHVASGKCRVSVSTNAALTNTILIRGEVQGFGWPWSHLRHHAAWTQTDKGAQLDFSFTTQGYFSELDGQVMIDVPPGTPVARE